MGLLRTLARKAIIYGCFLSVPYCCSAMVRSWVRGCSCCYLSFTMSIIRVPRSIISFVIYRVAGEMMVALQMWSPTTLPSLHLPLHLR